MTTKELDRGIAGLRESIETIDKLKTAAINADPIRSADLALLRQIDLKLYGLFCELTVERFKQNALDEMLKPIHVVRS